MEITLIVSLSAVSILFAILFSLQLLKNKRAKKEIKSFENIVYHTNDALFVLEIVNGKILHVNHSSELLLGYTEKELMGKPYAELLPKEYLHKSSEIIADVWESKGLVFSDIPHLKKNGETVPVECSAKIGSFDEHAVIVIYMRDITERLKMENAIKEFNRELTEKNTEITDSIRYAKRIQQAILPDEEESYRLLPEHFVLFLPKDIVSGDFYFIEPINTNTGVHLSGFASVDCTGHGVPGAFMSLLGHSFFKQALTETGVNSAGETLDFVNKKLVNSLKYKHLIGVRDGMDASFGVLNRTTNDFYFAGANNPCLIISDGEVIEIPADKRSIGQEDDPAIKFTTHSRKMKKGDMIFLYSDGYADQFGGPKGKKFKYKQLDDLLLANCLKPLGQQRELLEKTFLDWKGSLEQVDDVLIIGVRA
jgi:PAS domain S-box-containing protein